MCTNGVFQKLCFQLFLKWILFRTRSNIGLATDLILENYLVTKFYLWFPQSRFLTTFLFAVGHHDNIFGFRLVLKQSIWASLATRINGISYKSIYLFGLSCQHLSSCLSHVFPKMEREDERLRRNDKVKLLSYKIAPLVA